MKVRVENLFAECPYCGSTDFASPEADSRELVCERCDGCVSRQLLLERLGDAAAESARASLSRLKEERVKKRKKD